jgi:pyroglutamyl-peptidase
MRTPARQMLDAARTARVPVRLSRDAGRYLCNYLCWRVTEAARDKDEPRLAAFIHVPLVRRHPVPSYRIKKKRASSADLLRAGRRLLRVAASTPRR